MSIRNLILIVGLALLLWSFDHMMRADAKRMCSNDETAYAGCERNF